MRLAPHSTHHLPYHTPPTTPCPKLHPPGGHALLCSAHQSYHDTPLHALRALPTAPPSVPGGAGLVHWRQWCACAAGSCGLRPASRGTCTLETGPAESWGHPFSTPLPGSQNWASLTLGSRSHPGSGSAGLGGHNPLGAVGLQLGLWTNRQAMGYPPQISPLPPSRTFYSPPHSQGKDKDPLWPTPPPSPAHHSLLRPRIKAQGPNPSTGEHPGLCLYPSSSDTAVGTSSWGSPF